MGVIKNFTEWLNFREWKAEAAQQGIRDEVIVDPGTAFEFVKWGSTPRLFRPVVVTEKLDGTNGAVIIEAVPMPDVSATRSLPPDVLAELFDARTPNCVYWVGAQSRNRVLRRDEPDNQGFRQWVTEHAGSLVDDLGPGRHFGEFWGHKIARNYGLTEKRFSLFNPATEFKNFVPHADGDVEVIKILTPGLGTVPVLYEGPLDTDALADTLANLQDYGSAAAPGFMRPEGIVVYHTHARRIIGKVTLDNQDKGKWEAKTDG